MHNPRHYRFIVIPLAKEEAMNQVLHKSIHKDETVDYTTINQAHQELVLLVSAPVKGEKLGTK